MSSHPPGAQAEDPWATAAADDGLDGGQPGLDPSGQESGLGAPPDEFDDNIVDVHAAEARPRRKSRAVLVGLVLTGFGVVGGSGMMIYSLYSKLFPSAQSRQPAQVDSAAIDTAATAAPAKPPSPPPAAPALPGGDPAGLGASHAAGALPGLFPAASGTTAQVLPAGPTQASGPASNAQVQAQPIASAAAPDSAAPVQVAIVTAPVAAAAETQTAPAAPAPTHAAAVAATAASPASINPKTRSARAGKPTRTAVDVAQESSPTKRKPVHSGRTAARTTSGSTTPARTAAGTALTEIASDTLSRYRLMSIWPRSGDFQQAWVRDPKGRIHILQAGDSIEGMKVVNVDFKQYVVRTAQGQIR